MAAPLRGPKAKRRSRRRASRLRREVLRLHRVLAIPPEAAYTALVSRVAPPPTLFHGGVTALPYPGPAGRHLHAAFEVQVVLTGEIEQYLPTWSQPLVPGSVTLVSPWEPHGWRALAPGTTLVSVHFDAGFLREVPVGEVRWTGLFAAPAPARPRAQSTRVREQVLPVARELALEMEHGSPGWLVAARLAVLKLLFVIGRDWEKPLIADGLRSGTGGLARIAPALRLVHEHPGRRVPLAEAAADCGINRSYFSELFKALMGMGFAEYALRFRLAQAADLLLNTSACLDEIAASSGFVDSSHLHRCFTRRHGLTPAQYRDGRTMQRSSL